MDRNERTAASACGIMKLDGMRVPDTVRDSIVRCLNDEAIFDFANRCTHTDHYTFSKATYTQSRDYSPSKRYSAAKRSAVQEEKETATAKGKNNKKDKEQASAKPASSKKSREESRTTHKVAEGENLTKIAAKNGLTVAQLKKMNGLTSDDVRVGKVLRVK